MDLIQTMGEMSNMQNHPAVMKDVRETPMLMERLKERGMTTDTVKLIDKHSWTPEQKEWVLSNFKTLEDTGASKKSISETLVSEFNKTFSTNFTAKRLLGQYYAWGKRDHKKSEKSPLNDLVRFKFIIVRPSPSNPESHVFDYADTPMDVQHQIAKICAQNGGILPPGVKVFGEIKLEYKTEVTLEGMSAQTGRFTTAREGKI